MTGAVAVMASYGGSLIPVVSSISPNTSTIAGGVNVTITGKNFTWATSATVGGSAVTNFTVVSDTSITCTVPSGSAGTASVVVTSPYGSNKANTLWTYTYPVPTITGISPTSGPIQGNTTVTITGTNFINVTAVKFGTTNATNFTANSTTQITATSPTETAGVIDIRVTAAGGTTATSSADQFTYMSLAPLITGISPSSGYIAGGTTVTLTGVHFTGVTAVTIGGTPATSVVVNSDTSLTCVVPAGSIGTASVIATNSYGSNSSNTLWTYIYPPPTITGVSPSSGTTLGGTSVVITGTEFIGVTAVKFGTLNASSYTVNSSTQITATAPAESAGIIDITVTARGGGSSVQTSDQFTYTSPIPIVTSVSPNTGGGGLTVTITGQYFTGATSVTLGGNPATSVVVNSDTSITCVIPSHPIGQVSVNVTTASGTNTNNTLFNYTNGGYSGVDSAEGLVTHGYFDNAPHTGYRITTSTGSATVNSITNSILGSSGMTTLNPLDTGNFDDGYWHVTLPFSINYLGTSYNDFYVGTNSYITFTAGSTIYTNVSNIYPALPKILLATGDNYSNNAWSQVSGSAPNRTFRIRVQGVNSSSGPSAKGLPVPDGYNIEYEVTFYESPSNQFDVQFGVNAIHA